MNNLLTCISEFAGLPWNIIGDACSMIQRLNLSGWKALTDSGLGVLRSCCNLRSLRLIGTDGVTGDGLHALSACIHLQVRLVASMLHVNFAPLL